MIKKILAVLLFSLVCGWISVAGATSLQDLFDGTEIEIGDKIFSDWELINVVSTNSLNDPDFNLIDVIALNDEPLNPGLSFTTNGQLSVTDFDLDFLDVSFGFTASTSSGAKLIKDNSLEITGYTFGTQNVGGGITITETVTSATGEILGEKFTEVDNLNSIYNPFDSAEFEPQDTIHIVKNILIYGDNVGDVVSLDSFTQRFSQVPEPATMLLFGIGLMGLAGVSRKKE